MKYSLFIIYFLTPLTFFLSWITNLFFQVNVAYVPAAEASVVFKNAEFFRQYVYMFFNTLSNNLFQGMGEIKLYKV